MIIRLLYLVNYLSGRDIAGRTLYKRSDDVFLVAYPGSGGQWLRRLVANLLNPSNLTTESNIDRRVPDLYHVSRRSFAKIIPPRFIFSHESFDPGYRKTLYLVRDPRDVAVSLYQQHRKSESIQDSLSLEQFVFSVFLTGYKSQCGWSEDFSGSIKANRSFAYRSRLKHEFLGTAASWGDNVMSWIGARGRDKDGLLLIQYEQLASNPEHQLTRIADYLHLDGSTERIRLALQADRRLSTPQEPGKWRAVLPESAVKAIESNWGNVMTTVGYALDPCAKACDWAQARMYA